MSHTLQDAACDKNEKVVPALKELARDFVL